MPDPTGRVSHLPHFHRGVAWKEPCRVATTANITIATALNAGDTIDGITLAAGDRVLVKDQSTGSQNGIYIAGASPARAYDMDQDGTTSVPASEVTGAFVWVLQGTANAQTLWHTTNTGTPTLGTTSIVWTEFTASPSSGGGGGFDVTPPQALPLPPWVKPTGSGAITSDPQGRITVDSSASYKAFPGITLLEGRLHLVYRDGAEHNSANGVAKYRYSDNLGRTWSSATTLITPPSGDDVRDPYVTALSSGRLILSYNIRTPWNGATIQGYVKYSDDRGQSWSSAYTLPDTIATNEADVTAPVVELPDGTLIMPGYGDVGGLYRTWIWTSTDGGETWPTQTTVAVDGTASLNEITIRQLASGKLVALMRDETSGDTYRSVSTDLGATWSAEAMVIDNNIAGRPDFVEIWPSVLLWFGRGTSFASRWAVSWDEGATWTALQETDSGETLDSEYHAPLVLAPGYVIVVYSIENSSTDADLYVRYYFDGYGVDPIGQARYSGLFLNGVEFDDTDPDDGEVWTYDSGTGKYVLEAPAAGSSVPPAILLESGHATPFTFDEILQESDGSDFLWASE